MTVLVSQNEWCGGPVLILSQIFIFSHQPWEVVRISSVIHSSIGYLFQNNIPRYSTINKFFYKMIHRLFDGLQVIDLMNEVASTDHWICNMVVCRIRKQQAMNDGDATLESPLHPPPRSIRPARDSSIQENSLQGFNFRFLSLSRVKTADFAPRNLLPHCQPSESST